MTQADIVPSISHKFKWIGVFLNFFLVMLSISLLGCSAAEHEKPVSSAPDASVVKVPVVEIPAVKAPEASSAAARRAVTAVEPSTAGFASGFLGVWDTSIAQCAKKESATRLTISEGVIRYWESKGVIEQVLSQSPTHLKVKLSMSGEGETWSVVSEFSLLDHQLTEHFAHGQLSARVPCETDLVH